MGWREKDGGAAEMGERGSAGVELGWSWGRKCTGGAFSPGTSMG